MNAFKRNNFWKHWLITIYYDSFFFPSFYNKVKHLSDQGFLFISKPLNLIPGFAADILQAK